MEITKILTDNEYYTKDGVKLTKSQTTVLHKMIAWADPSNDSIVFTLSGFAGTGKTTLVEVFITEIIKKYEHYSKNKVCVTAPTHKAKKVIASRTGIKGMTVQALLGLRPNVEIAKFNINMPTFAQLGDELIQDFKIVGTDECSMMNKGLDKLLRQRAKFWNVKILYIGDAYQLPPVKELLSTTFTHVKNFEKLDEIVRQEKGNPLLELIGKVRNDIINGTNLSASSLLIPKENINKKGQGFLITNKESIIEECITDLYRDSPQYDTNKDFVKFIAWTNPNVKQWNKFIRNIVFLKPKLIINHDDLLMAYKGVVNKGGKQMLANSEECTVRSFSNAVNKYGITGYKVTLEKPKGSKIQVFIVAPSGYTTFIEVHEAKLKKAKESGRFWKQYYEFKGENLLMSDAELNGRLIVKKDLDYGYCCTVHKTQGSTYDNVIINGKNINRNKTRIDRLKLWYVALSRASKQAVIYI